MANEDAHPPISIREKKRSSKEFRLIAYAFHELQPEREHSGRIVTSSSMDFAVGMRVNRFVMRILMSIGVATFSFRVLMQARRLLYPFKGCR